MLELKNITFTRDGKNILKGVNLALDNGQTVVITGPNGSGKSTLAKLIMGIYPPDKGNVFFDGTDITRLSITQRAKLGIGFALQSPVRFKGLFVRDLLRLAVGKDLSTEEACKYLSEVGLCASDYIDREVNNNLSGGEIKRIEIATLIARKTKLSVFDEPEAGIDLWSFQSLIRCFENLKKETGGSIIIISHQERILDIADKIIVVADGFVVGEGKKAEMMPKILDCHGTCSYYK